MTFVHLHVHTQYSILDGLSSIRKLFERARELGMPALAITDHGNMYGVKEFFKYAYDKSNKDAEGNLIVRPIIGCEVYVTRHYDHTLKDSDHRKYYHLILLAKNYNGYRNLMKICSIGHTEGKYYEKPRVDHATLEKYHQDLICCSACLAGEVPKDIIDGDFAAAEEAIEWHKNLFGEDYYLEVMLHKTRVEGLPQEVYSDVYGVYEKQCIVNDAIFGLAARHGVKTVATNDVHFVRQEDGPVHDRLICLTTNANITDTKRLHYTQEEYLKSGEEMASLFPDHPEALAATVEIAGKISDFKIDRGHVLPKFDLPEEFLAHIDEHLDKYADVIDAGKFEETKEKDSDGKPVLKYRGDQFCRSVAYLCHLTFQGARERYGEVLDQEHLSRIDFELETIAKMGFPDYFLIVQDYIAACRAMGDLVGPGRGSAAGSVVAYCLKITNLDPIKYQLLFERFLNPDRVSMPDIDVDFESLPNAHRYVEQHYGADHVSRVITFGTMAAKSAIKDVARITQLPLAESERLTRMIPARLSEKVEKEYPFNPKLDDLKPGFVRIDKEVEEDDPDHEGQKRKVIRSFQKGKEDQDVKITLSNCYRLVPELKNELENGDPTVKEVLYYAQKLEGSIRQVGMHACATIIGPCDITDNIPICLSTDKDTGKEVWTSQYDGHYIEDVGMLKMDFLGLNTLSIIKETLNLIKQRFGTDIDIEKIPVDDASTYELYGRGDTTAVFQFESPGMREWLQKLHPERFEDLIAMNALYRPGPMDYIPSFVARKLGKEPISYDLPQMEEYLKDTYGITVYQEQVMLLSQKLANFTKGQADTLRKAMGKKQIDTLQSLRGKFMEGGQKNGHPEKVLDKIWKDWEKFAQYAFNKSHATCYAWVSYQTGWLKSHYTAEFIAANMSCNLNNMDEITKLMDDSRHFRIRVLGPDINESYTKFTVNQNGDIRFGMGGIKNVGPTIVDSIIAERDSHGPFTGIFDFIERMPQGAVNRKTLESLACAGAFDSFGEITRPQFFVETGKDEIFLDQLVRYAVKFQTDTMNAVSNLFGDVEELKPVRPAIPPAGDFNELAFLQKEKELVGMYISAHPLDPFRFELSKFTTVDITEFNGVEARLNTDRDVQNREFILGGMVTDVDERRTKSDNKPWCRFTIQDYSGSHQFTLFSKQYETFMKYMHPNMMLLVKCSSRKGGFTKKDESGRDLPEQYSMRIENMRLLANSRDDFVPHFHIHTDLDSLTPENRKCLKNLLKHSKGNARLYFDVNFEHDGLRDHVTMFSKDILVSPSDELINGIEALGFRCSCTIKVVL